VRRSSNTHLTEITLGQGPSPIASYSLLSPSSVASEQDGQGHTTTLSSTNTPFDTAGAVYSSTEDDYREDTGGTNSVTPDSTDLGTVNIEPASNPSMQCSAPRSLVLPSRFLTDAYFPVTLQMI